VELAHELEWLKVFEPKYEEAGVQLLMATFDQLISRLDPDNQLRGRQFECICAWFLKNAQRYRGKIKEVWLFAEWPGRWGPDCGVDVIAETVDGEIWAVQAKCYDPSGSVSKRDIDSFLSESSRPGVSHRILVMTTDKMSPNARRTIRAQAIGTSVISLQHLRAEPLDWPEEPNKLLPSKSIIPISYIAGFFAGIPVTFLWLAGIIVEVLIVSILFKSVRFVVRRVFQVGLTVLLVCGLLVGAYCLFFDRCGALAAYEDGRNVRLFGVCREVRISSEGDGRRASFLLRDPTGASRVVTTTGAPPEGSFLYLLGRKGTFDANNTFVESDYQLSPF